MAKSKKRKEESKKSSHVDSEGLTLGHNPFASLSAFGGRAPEPATEAPPVITPRPASKTKARSAPTANAKPASKPKAPPKAPPKVTAMSTPKATASSSEFPDKLVVRREVKGRSGKTVTRISGIAPAKLSDLAKKMKKALGCGAVVEGSDIILLGSLVDRAAAWLEKAGATRIVKGN